MTVPARRVLLVAAGGRVEQEGEQLGVVTGDVLRRTYETNVFGVVRMIQAIDRKSVV